MPAKTVPSAAPWIPNRLTQPVWLAAPPSIAKAAICSVMQRRLCLAKDPRTLRSSWSESSRAIAKTWPASPFVGPAGKLLDRAMAEAGIDRQQVYVTNAVKHFKFVERGKRRIHAKPTGIEITACSPWLEAELAAIHPELVVCLGATAAQSLMGRDFRITRDRGVSSRILGPKN